MSSNASALRALQAAATKNALSKVQSALSKVDVSSPEVSAILRQAIAKGHGAVAAAILSAGARPAPGEGVPLIIAALRLDAAEIVAPLLASLAADADVDSTAAPGGWTALFWAAKRGDRALVEALLGAGASVSKTERMGGTPLMVAVQHLQPDASEALLQAGADVEACDSAGWSALLWAAQAGDAAMVRRLLLAGAKATAPGGHALMVAVENGRVEAAAALLGARRTLDGTLLPPPPERPGGGSSSPEQTAPTEGAPIVDLDARDAQGWSAVAVAAGAGHTRLLSMLLAAGASADARTAHTGRTPLMAAAQGGHAAAAEALIRHAEDHAEEVGAEAGAAGGGAGGGCVRAVAGGVAALVGATDAQRVTALMLAAKNGHTAATKALLAARADASATDMAGHGALELCARKGAADVARAILASGALAAAAGPFSAAAGGSLGTHAARALPIAAKHGHVELVKLLAGFGAPTQPHLMRAAAGGATEVRDQGNMGVGAAAGHCRGGGHLGRPRNPHIHTHIHTHRASGLT